MHNVTTGTVRTVATGLDSHDMRDQVSEALGDLVCEYDVPAIVEALQAEHGTVDVDTIPHDAFWSAVMDHDSTGALPVR